MTPLRKRTAAVIITAAAIAGFSVAACSSGSTAAPPGAPASVSAPAAIAQYTDPDGYACPTDQAVSALCPGNPAFAETTAPADTAAPLPADTTPAAPAMTAAQEQAVAAAQSYLEMGSGFSYNSLLDQLTSSAGEGFNQADAKFAISYLDPDWNAQAVMAAKGYLNLGTGFSRSGLIEQLTSAYGDGFTQAQAEYAAGKVGL